MEVKMAMAEAGEPCRRYKATSQREMGRSLLLLRASRWGIWGRGGRGSEGVMGEVTAME
jgi:hypothetical protein